MNTFTSKSRGACNYGVDLHPNRSTLQADSQQPHASCTLTARARASAAAEERRRARGIESDYGRWDSSTQVPKTIAKPLKHQILNRTFEPTPQAYVDPARAQRVVRRLSKGTISSRMKEQQDGYEGTRSGRLNLDHQRVEVDRKRYHLQRKHSAETNLRDNQEKVDRIQMLRYYRKEVEKRLRADPLCMIQTNE